VGDGAGPSARAPTSLVTPASVVDARRLHREVPVHLRDPAQGASRVLQDGPNGNAEDFGELLGVVDGQEKESAVGGEPSLQHQRVPVGVRSQEITKGLKCNRCCRFQKGGSCSQAIELPDQGEDEGGYGGEQPLEKTNCRCGRVSRSCSSKYRSRPTLSLHTGHPAACRRSAMQRSREATMTPRASG
jgi:hypothetical protein